MLLKINLGDIKYISKLYIKDYNSIIENKFFIKFPDEKNSFEEVKIRLDKKIKELQNISDFYFVFLLISNVVIIGLILGQLNFSKIVLIPICLIITLFMLFFRGGIFERD